MNHLLSLVRNGLTNPCKLQPSEELRSTNRESDLPDSCKEWFESDNQEEDNPHKSQPSEVLRLTNHESDSHDLPDSRKEWFDSTNQTL